MSTPPLYYELPAKLTTKKFLTKLSKKADIQIASQQHAITSFYDSFDWRFYNANMVCEFNHSKTASDLNLIDRSSGKIIASEKMQNIPTFSGQFGKGELKTQLESILEMRALLPLCHLPHEVYRINILNKDQKIILRIQVADYEHFNSHVSFYPLKGYEKAVKNLSDILQKSWHIKPATCCSVLNAALKQQSRRPRDYSSKSTIKLKPKTRADKASKTIYRHLLQVMKINESGTIMDIDTEYLHDFRVAVRRTRAGLNQLKNTLPAKEVAPHTDFFAWLGQITGPTRDLDVYLLNYKQYKAALPLSLRDDLEPFYFFLKEKQVQAQKELATKLNSTTYKKQLTAWEQYLKEPLPKKATESHANLTIKDLADQRIWKIYRRLLKEGKAISESSSAEALHDLRKTCKKLRYLMEFFLSLYPTDKIKASIKVLKGFQTVLGDFQDYEVQEMKVKQFSEEMRTNDVSTKTFMAMGVLAQYLDAKRLEARNNFSEQFTVFKQAKNQAAFKHLFAQKA
jgi:CHAD domain-containing protein